MVSSPDRWARSRPVEETASEGSRYYTPQGSHEELLVQSALGANRQPRAEMEMYNRFYDDPHPARDLAFMQYRSRTLSIDDVLGETRGTQDTGARDYSGSPAGFTGTLRYSMGGW